MSGHARRVLSIPPGVPFLPTLAKSLLEGQLIAGFRWDGDPLALADVSIFVPTRRAARALRGVFAEALGTRAAILPTIRPLGEFDEEAAYFDAAPGDALRLSPPVPALDRLLLLAPLVRAWKARLPAHLAARYDEPFVVPASTADAIWLARDLCVLLDELETEGADSAALAGLVDRDLAGWWELTLDFLAIVTENWPAMLAERGRSDPAAYRNAMIDAETTRLAAAPPRGPVIAAGSTGSVPATARLLAAVAAMDGGAVVLPGLDTHLDRHSWEMIGDVDAAPSAHGHPQFGLRKLIGRLGIAREEIEEIGTPARGLVARAALVSEALRPAETSDAWAERRAEIDRYIQEGALGGVGLVEAANEREEARAIAVALRLAIAEGKQACALVTADRELARRVASELQHFGIRADDSGGSPLRASAPAGLFRLLLESVFRPGDPVAVLSLLKHPLLSCGLDRGLVRRAVETIELVALRGGVGRPDAAALRTEFESRLARLDAAFRKPFWLARLDDDAMRDARGLLGALSSALTPLAALRRQSAFTLTEVLAASIAAFEALGREPDGLRMLYGGDAGEAFASFLRDCLAVETDLVLAPREWPDIFDALIATEVVKPRAGGDPRVAILGTLEARLQSFDFLAVGGLNEGSWPPRLSGDRFMSRLMKAAIALDPPERRIGLAAHDFTMAAGAPELLLSRSLRAGDAPAVASRWLQRLIACAGPQGTEDLRRRGDRLLAWARQLDEEPRVAAAIRPRPQPPLGTRPGRFSVTEIETLRRDPYAIYARHVLRLAPVDPLLRDPGAAERGNLFHEILHRYAKQAIDPNAPDAQGRLVSLGRDAFAEEGLPADIEAVWWPRFLAMAPHFLAWERERADVVVSRLAEAVAAETPVADTGVSLRGRADRIDLLPGGFADIIDYKTGSSPSLRQAHVLVSPQLALEGALLRRGAFAQAGRREPADLAHVRLKPDGRVEPETILVYQRQARSAPDLAEDAWGRLEKLLLHFADPASGYVSRALPFRETDTDGDYDHLARVLEWSAGATAEAEGDE